MDEMHERTSLQNLHQKKKKNSKSTCESCGYNFSQNGTNAETVHQGIRNHIITNVESTLDILLLAVNSRTKSVKKIILTTSTA